MKNLFLKIFTFYVFLLPNIFCIKPIQFINGGYRGITVAIYSKITENDKLLNNLENLIRKASEFLYDATEGRAQFAEIDIILPQSWNKTNRRVSIAGSFYDKAHVRVGLPYGDNDAPFTVQPRGCGESGEYIQFSDAFILEIGDKNSDFPSPEKTFLHEWAHYRYGVFDEYGIPGDPNFPTFHIRNGRIHPTTCVDGIVGTARDKYGKKCKMYSGGQIDSKCLFIPDPKENDAIASIMFMSDIPTINTFCESNTSDSKRLHNRFAPTKHNILCNYRSVSEVIYGHDDFTKAVSQSKPKYQEPVFQYYVIDKHMSSRFVLVLDVSGSMSDNNRIKLLNRAATRFVRDIIPEGLELGIIKFSTASEIIHDMTIINDASRITLSDSIPNTTESSTAIGKGLKDALRILQANNGSTHSATIILVTDGEENIYDPSIEEIMPEIYDAGIKVDTIAVSVNADEKLENVSRISGGKCFYMNDDDKATNTFLGTLFSEITAQEFDIDVQKVNIKNERIRISNNRIFYRIVIDSELGKNTRFTVHSDDIDKMEIKFISPDYHVYAENDLNYLKDMTHHIVQLYLPVSETGVWEVMFMKDNSYDQTIDAVLTVTSEPTNPNDHPVRIKAYFGKLEVRYPAMALIFAEVFKGNRPVIGADVVANVKRPIGESVEIRLNDNGRAYDSTANDGIYTTSFTQFNSDGRYSISTRIQWSPQTRLRNNYISRVFSGSIRIPKTASNSSFENAKSEFSFDDFVMSENQSESHYEENDKTEPIEEFTRANEIGTFKVSDFTSNKDIIPPGRVTDLTVMIFLEEKHIIELQWTAPGDDDYYGNISKIDLRMGKSQDLLHNSSSFNDNFAITEPILLSGNLNNIIGGTVQKVKFRIPNEFFNDNLLNKSSKMSIYFALRGIDESDNTGEISNIVGTHFGYILHDMSGLSKSKIIVSNLNFVYLMIILLTFFLISF